MGWTKEANKHHCQCCWQIIDVTTRGTYKLSKQISKKDTKSGYICNDCAYALKIDMIWDKISELRFIDPSKFDRSNFK